jgi:cyclic beta-1,2-glucan synthetase
MTQRPALPPLHQIGNGRYRVQLSEAGGGLSSCSELALSRWPGDRIEDAHGFFVYLRDLDTGALWSAGLQPTLSTPARYELRVSAESLVIERRDGDVESVLTVSLLPGRDAEQRHLRLCNRGSGRRRIEVTSYLEIALAPAQVDLVHPSFSKLFVQTEYRDDGTLLARRRARAQDESWPVLFHRLTGATVEAWETDRCRFIGRGRSASRPSMCMQGTVGNVLDPVFCLRTTLELAAGSEQEIGFLFGVLAEAPGSALPVPKLPAAPETGRIDHGFSADGSEYVLRLPWHKDAPALPPMPWVNVIANPRFGFIVSETGAGGSWSRNSQANRLTPWYSDPVCDPHGEALYLRDEDSGAFWSPMPGPVPACTTHEVRHGFGYSSFISESQDLTQQVTVFAARQDPLKILRLQLHNRGPKPRRLSLFAYQRLVLGTLPATDDAVFTWQRDDVLCARRTAADEFADGIVFCFIVADRGGPSSFSCDRRAFLGLNGSPRSPQALREPRLDGAQGGGLDPCFAQQRGCELAPGQSAVLSIVFGEALGAQELEDLRMRYVNDASIDAALRGAVAGWAERLGGIRVHTPAPEIDAMVNGWLPYQALSCRLWGRTAFYQSSGAIGFRDQLQDAGNLALLWPEIARQQILLHARHQFAEGDVLHWWHDAPLERGVRTRFSDDLLWLAWVSADYAEHTGDLSVFDEDLPFLEAPILEPGEDERYLQPRIGAGQASLYEHCCRAIDRSLRRGPHGLPLMGTGDWNDGMNRVGREGRGESVWLGFFLFDILEQFGKLAEQRGDPGRAQRYAVHREELRSALEGAGWDGAWYRRAYYDDGTPLGTSDAEECRIDGLVQAWAVLSGAAPDARAAQALDAAETQLVNEAQGLIHLLTPSFENTPQDPGYIKGYVAGVRENGGQYTHAACWLVAAQARLGRRDRAARLLTRMSPQWHTRDAEALQRYQVEPYVIAADIYGAEPHIGRGGWTWYTGSAGWAYRVAVESVLGLRLDRGRSLLVQPCIPDDWPGYRIDYRHPDSATIYRIEIRNPQHCSEAVVGAVLDGAALPVSGGVARLPLIGDGALHLAVITLGSKR